MRPFVYLLLGAVILTVGCTPPEGLTDYDDVDSSMMAVEDESNVRDQEQSNDQSNDQNQQHNQGG